MGELDEADYEMEELRVGSEEAERDGWRLQQNGRKGQRWWSGRWTFHNMRRVTCDKGRYIE